MLRWQPPSPSTTPDGDEASAPDSDEVARPDSDVASRGLRWQPPTPPPERAEATQLVDWQPQRYVVELDRDRNRRGLIVVVVASLLMAAALVLAWWLVAAPHSPNIRGRLDQHLGGRVEWNAVGVSSFSRSYGRG